MNVCKKEWADFWALLITGRDHTFGEVDDEISGGFVDDEGRLVVIGGT